MSVYKSKYFYSLQKGKHKVHLKPGTYQIECWGAQGGTGNRDASLSTEGGRGAYVSGEISFQESIDLYIFIGGKGSDGSRETFSHAAGGFNGGGTAGCDTTDDDGSGGGGGATDVRYVDGNWDSPESLYSRIIVAGGGSGSAFKAYGAPGGDICGYLSTQIGNEHFTTSISCQKDGYKLGIGSNGSDSSATPSSGAGGGYWGGVDGTPTEQGMKESQTYMAISSSGSSFILGHPGCIATNENGEPTDDENYNSKYKFHNTLIVNGLQEFLSPLGVQEKGHSGDGAVLISLLTDSPLSAACDKKEKCTTYCLNHHIQICTIFNLLT